YDPGSDDRAVSEAHAGRPAATDLHGGDLCRHERNAERSRLSPQRLRQSVAVEPAFAREAQTAGSDAVAIEIREAACKRRLVEVGDVGAKRNLQGMVGAQRCHAGRRSEEQVAAFAEADIRAQAIDGEPLAGAPQE